MILLGIAVIFSLCGVLIFLNWYDGDTPWYKALAQFAIALVLVGTSMFFLSGCGPSSDDIRDDCNQSDQYIACASVGGRSERCCCSSFNEARSVDTRCS